VNGSARIADAGLPEIVRFFLRNFWLIAGLSLACGILTYGASFLMTPKYRAEILLVSVEESGGGAFSSLLSNFGGLGRLAGLGSSRTNRKDEALAMLRSRTFVFEFIDANDGYAVLYPKMWNAEAGTWRGSPEAVPSKQDAYIDFTSSVMGVSENRDSGIITVTIKLRDRNLAARWANDIVSMLNQEFRDRVSSEAQRSMEYLEEELEKASSVELRQVIHRLIESQIQTITLTNVRKEFVFRVIDPAVAPDQDHYVSPRPVLYAFIGIVIGGFLGLCVAAFREAMHKGKAVQAASD
jgi:uncharacterized protein involved in exopolysaccharide biosynthesis